LLKKFPGRIINIHPALLPRHGGQGMFGKKVHEAVLASGDRQSGITIHFVNEKYDEGKIIFQQSIPIVPGETAETLAAKVHELEYRWYPPIIEEVLSKLA
jgi:phosphoribosylglycinamide formyltransferase-1